MPGSFDEREKGYEAKWVHDEELRFRVFSRRNRMLGLWAAGEMGLRGPEAEAYAKDIIAAEFEKDGENAIFTRIRRDFDSHKIALSDHMIRRRMDELLDSAKIEIERESGR